MSALVFSVRAADSADVHRMEATHTGRGVRFTCTCPDGSEGRHCEHRIALLLGDASALVEVDQEAVDALATMTKGSPLLQAVHRLAQAEAAAAEAQLDLERAKQVIATILMG
ncbi:calcium-binding EGF-like domain-containing protein [Methylobacterium nigriterrae]|uniref:calcium-binding EGF-like domain-containing protein n=1 Tax=Methylobacterium nigriterrae TaxID=3127512 RepID=UPI0030136257